jgi:heme/copper-type cytochrome/quinol oxidase subunit 1
MFVNEMQQVWRKYVQIALFIIGTSSGVNIYNLQKFFQDTNKKFSIELMISEAWESVRSAATSIILSMLVLFFVYLIVSYLNQLAPMHPKKSEEKPLDANALEKEDNPQDEKL